jgi:hypothetical protein
MTSFLHAQAIAVAVMLAWAATAAADGKADGVPVQLAKCGGTRGTTRHGPPIGTAHNHTRGDRKQ